MERVNPPEDGINEPVMVFDPYQGANFKLIIKTIKTNGVAFKNYDSSTFSEITKIGTDEEIEKIDSELYDLNVVMKDITDFKSYDEIKQRFEKFEHIQTSAPAVEQSQPAPAVEQSQSAPAVGPKPSEPAPEVEKSEDSFFSKILDS